MRILSKYNRTKKEVGGKKAEYINSIKLFFRIKVMSSIISNRPIFNIYEVTTSANMQHKKKWQCQMVKMGVKTTFNSVNPNSCASLHAINISDCLRDKVNADNMVWR